MRQMLEAGVHFGHQTRYWNPKMGPFIFGERNKIHIINLEKTLPLYQDAMNFVGRTGRQRRQDPVRRHQACGPRGDRRGGAALRHALRQPPLARRHADQLQDHPPVHQAAQGSRADVQDGTIERFTKKEALGLRREMDKLEQSLGGIKDMDGLPDALFVIDVGHENIAVQEANKLGIPVHRRGRHQQFAGRRGLRHSRQRRRHPRDPALCRRCGRGGPGRSRRAGRGPRARRSSSKFRKRRCRRAAAPEPRQPGHCPTGSRAFGAREPF